MLAVTHTLVLFYSLVSLNVAINSYDNALLTLLLSNQFVEIKGAVFKKFEKENLFQMSCAGGSAPAMEHSACLLDLYSSPELLFTRHRGTLPAELDALYHRNAQSYRAQRIDFLITTYIFHPGHAVNDHLTKHLQSRPDRSGIGDVRRLAQACFHYQVQP